MLSEAKTVTENGEKVLQTVKSVITEATTTCTYEQMIYFLYVLKFKHFPS